MINCARGCPIDKLSAILRKFIALCPFTNRWVRIYNAFPMLFALKKIHAMHVSEKVMKTLTNLLNSLNFEIPVKSVKAVRKLRVHDEKRI